MLIENKNQWQTKSCTEVFIWDKRQKDKSEKESNHLKGEICYLNFPCENR